ncbi:hypothetical protein [Rhabdothermincola sp.]|uniref:hypothetical protein n=1 Tax=Rhabdothermincola sp. TaxID=2820405 RepID=UPI002FE11FAB
MAARTRGAPRPWPLAVLTAGIMTLAVAGLIPRWPGLVQLVGLPPLGVTTDLRLLLSESEGFVPFIVMLVPALAVRIAVLTAMTGELSARRVGFVARFYALALPFAGLAAASAFAAGATLYYLLFWVGVAMTVAEVLLLAAIPWMGEPSVWRAVISAARAGFRAGTVGAYLVGVTLIGAAAEAGGPAAAIGLLPVSAAFTYAAAYLLSVDPDRRGLRVGRRIVAATGALLVTVTVAVATGPARPVERDRPGAPRSGSLMLMGGIDSSSGSSPLLSLVPGSVGFTCEQTFFFSYAGPGSGQPEGRAACPIRTGAPYTGVDTYRSIDELVRFLVEQIEPLPPPVTLIAHSQGVWVVLVALSAGLLPTVSDVVLVGALTDNPIGYPPRGGHAPGRVGTEVLDGVGALARLTSFSRFDPQSPLAVELLADPHRVAAIVSHPIPTEMAALSVPSAFDLPLMAETRPIEGAAEACPLLAVHPELPFAPAFVDDVNRFLDGRPPAACPWWHSATVGLRAYSAPPNH